MGEIILATVLMELGEAVVEKLERNLGGILALKEMLVELLATDQTDGAGLVGADGDGSWVAIETVGIAASTVLPCASSTVPSMTVFWPLAVNATRARMVVMSVLYIS